MPFEDIHPTAVVSPRASLGARVHVGPGAIVEADVEIGDDCRIDALAVIRTGTRLGARVEIHCGAVLGGVPQVRDRNLVPGRVEVGDDACIREHVTVHRASTPDGVTRVGRGAYLMACAHVAHDCELAEGVVLANGALLAGHVRVEAHAFLSGNVVVHQHVRIGARSLVRGGSRVGKDVPPFTIVSGTSRIRGLNTIGLRRAGVAPADRQALQRAYRLLYRSGYTLDRALHEIRALPACAVLDALLAFLGETRRSFCRPRPRMARRPRASYASLDIAG